MMNVRRIINLIMVLKKRIYSEDSDLELVELDQDLYVPNDPEVTRERYEQAIKENVGHGMELLGEINKE
jgi:hypothetical protein